MSKKVILVAGTWSWSPDKTTGEWHQPGSPFVQYLQAHGVQPFFGPGGNRSFIWSTQLDGLGLFESQRHHTTWAAAGHNLFDYIVPPFAPAARVPPDETAVVCHSHGLQPVLYALALGLKIDTLVSVSSPIRGDMMEIAKQGRPNVRQWLHLHSDGSDWMQWLGALFDGQVGIFREHPQADRNIAVPHVGHSQLLTNPQTFHYWYDLGLVEALQ